MDGKILAGKILVKATNIDALTASGIIIPESVREKPNSGRVLIIGADKPREPMRVSVGDIVLYSKNIGQDVELDGKDLLLIDQSDILFIQK
jgi:chaperonin GroES